MSVCSGIEAATVAWHPLGWEGVGFSEIDAFPCAVLAHHFPNVPNLGDMTRFKEWPDARPDVLVGGTPCQSFSIAGLRTGLDDPRGNLMLTYLAIAERYRPEWVVWENVPGVLSSNEGRDFGTFLTGLAKLGYGFAYRILDAQYFGVAQRRRRVFVVGHLGDWRRAAAVLFERESLSGNPPPSRGAGQKAAPTISARTKDGGGLGTDAELDGALIAGTLQASGKAAGSATQQDAESSLLVAETLRQHPRSGSNSLGAIAFGGNRTSGPIDVATAATAKPGARMDFASETFITHALRADGFDASEDGTGRGTPIVPITLAIRGRGDSSNLETRQDGTANAILTPSGGRAGIGVEAIAFNPRQDPIVSENIALPLDATSPGGGAIASSQQPAASSQQPAEKSVRAFKIRGGCEGGGKGFLAREDGAFTVSTHQDQHLHQGLHVRRLTPRECERLQGFPDDYTLIPLPLKGRQTRVRWASDGARYKAIGNSMAVPVMRWIGQRIQAVSQLEKVA